LAGAAGLGGEALLLTSVGLVIGQARATAVGLAVWIAAWALGAHLAGRGRSAPGKALLAWGLAAGVAAPVALASALALAGSSLGGAAALVAGTLIIALAALPQGGFLPLLARAGRCDDISWLFGANLAGGVLGAHLLAFQVPAAVGFLPAGLVVGSVAVLAAGLGRLGAAVEAPAGAQVEPAASDPVAPAALRHGVVVGLVTAWLAGVEWIGFRLGALWLGGMQPAVTAVLTASLVALAVGASLLPRILPRGVGGPRVALLLAALGGWLMVAGNLPGRIADPAGSPLLTALLLVAPSLVPLGAVVPLLYRSAQGESGARLGGLLLHEVWGALLGVPLVHWLLLPSLGAGGAVAALGLLSIPAAWALPGGGRRRLVLGSALSLGVAVLVLRAPEPARSTPVLSKPEFQVLSFAEDEHFAVTVINDGLRGERTLLTDDFRATAVGEDYLYMRVLGHLPLLLHPKPARVGVLAFGTGTTAGAVAKHPQVERIDVLELSRAVLDAAHHFHDVNGGVLEDPRTRVHLGDGRRTLGLFEAEFDVLTMEPLLPDSPFAVHLYTPGFYARVRRSLAPGGLLCQWVPPHALEPATFNGVVDAFSRSFPWSGVFLFGTQVILIGGDQVPALDPARFPGGGPDTPRSEDLRTALAALGLDTPAGVLSRFVTTGAVWPRSPRPLEDGDPWVIFRPRRRGIELLGDLPLNLAKLREYEQDPPGAWALVTGPGGLRRLGQVRQLHRALEAWHRQDYELRRAATPLGRRPAALAPTPDLGHLEVYRAELASSEDPEVVLFERMVAFQRAYQSGYQALVRGDPGAAFASFGIAGKLRPLRADVHLHAALAAYQAGDRDLARRLAREAFNLCPGLLETRAGQRVVQLGFPVDLRP
jgi:spermidine synthase